MVLLLLFRSRRIDVRSHWGFLRKREFRGISSIFGAAWKYGSGWIGQVILIGWKCSATPAVKLNYALNKNTSFFLLHRHLCLKRCHRFIKGVKGHLYDRILTVSWPKQKVNDLESCYSIYSSWTSVHLEHCFGFKSRKLNNSKFTNNSIKHQTFVYTQLNNQTVLFQTIHFSISQS